MPESKPNFNIIPRPEKSFRDESKNEKEDLDISFSGELVNEGFDRSLSVKRIEAWDKESNLKIGSIYYDEASDSFEVKVSGREVEYSGNGVGLSLYKELIRIAEKKNLKNIKSDCTVQGGAIAVWKKLQDLGYQVLVNPEIESKYKDFVELYNQNKYFKGLLSVGKTESVFVLKLEKDLIHEEK